MIPLQKKEIPSTKSQINSKGQTFNNQNGSLHSNVWNFGFWKLEFIWNTVVEEVVGDGKSVTGAKLKNIQTGQTHIKPIQGFFLGIGHQPNTEIFKGQLDMDEVGYLKIKGDTSFTNIAGVFAAGDVHDTRYRQAITAAGAGCKAAIDAERFLEEHGH